MPTERRSLGAQTVLRSTVGGVLGVPERGEEAEGFRLTEAKRIEWHAVGCTGCRIEGLRRIWWHALETVEVVEAMFRSLLDVQGLWSVQ